MKILVASHYLGGLTGSETFWATVIDHLGGRGAAVRTWAAVYGDRTGDLAAAGVDVRTLLPLPDEWRPDICLVSHGTIAERVYDAFPGVPIFYFGHGVLPELEKPPKGCDWVERWYAVSRETAEFLSARIPDHPQITWPFNPVDSGKFWRNSEGFGSRPDVLVVSNRMPPDMRGVVEAVCKEGGWSYRFIGAPVGVYEYGAVAWSMASARVVVSLGRGIIEAMMSEAVPVVFDYRGGDGIVCHGNVARLAERNFSGRTLELETDEANVKAHLAAAFDKDWESLRAWAVPRYDAKVLVDNLWGDIAEVL
jgi:glycosyltransferase involved in cell wall biosynthesis